MYFCRVSFPEIYLDETRKIIEGTGKTLVDAYFRRVAFGHGKDRVYVMYCSLGDAKEFKAQLIDRGKVLKTKRGNTGIADTLMRAGADINLEEKYLELVFTDRCLGAINEKVKTMGITAQKAFMEKTLEDQGRGPLYRMYCTRPDKDVLSEIVYSLSEHFSLKGVGL